MRRCIPGALLFAAAALSITACDDPAVPSHGDGVVEIVLDVSGAVAAGYMIDLATIDFTHLETEQRVEDRVEVSGGIGVAEVDLRPGMWAIEVGLMENGALVGQGRDTALVEVGFVTQVEMEIDLDTGGMRVEITWNDESLGTIADLSSTPVEVTIADLGRFEVFGLSRLGWDIEVIETPGSEGRTYKTPGDLSYPDVMMLRLTSSVAEVEALKSWMETETPRDMVFRLRGFGGEEALVVARNALAVGGNITGSVGEDGRASLAGLRVRFDHLESSQYTPADSYPPCPAPGQLVDIEGVAGYCYNEGRVQFPAAGTSDAVNLPALRDAMSGYNWARYNRDNLCFGCPAAAPASVLMQNLDAAREPTSTVIALDAWPASFTFFDPDQPYGHHYLFGIQVVDDRVDDA